MSCGGRRCHTGDGVDAVEERPGQARSPPPARPRSRPRGLPPQLGRSAAPAVSLAPSIETAGRRDQRGRHGGEALLRSARTPALTRVAARPRRGRRAGSRPTRDGEQHGASRRASEHGQRHHRLGLEIGRADGEEQPATATSVAHPGDAGSRGRRRAGPGRCGRPTAASRSASVGRIAARRAATSTESTATPTPAGRRYASARTEPAVRCDGEPGGGQAGLRSSGEQRPQITPRGSRGRARHPDQRRLAATAGPPGRDVAPWRAAARTHGGAGRPRGRRR